MKKFGRYISILLIILMLASMAVSCKKGPADDEDVVIDNSGSGESGGAGDSSDGDNSSGDGDNSSGGTTSTDKKPGQSGGGTSGGGTTSGNEQAEHKNNQGGTATGQVTEKEGYSEDETGKVVETVKGEVGEDYKITTAVTNDNAFVPDEEQGLEKSERRATEASKYDFDRNPLINRDRQQNKKMMPSFDINDTGFVRAGTKLEDLNKKTLTFFTADNFAAWSYRNEKGETIDEWKWFAQLKKELGLSIKYTVKQHMRSTDAALQSMNAGKNLDVVYSNHVTFPATLCITRSITELVNINNLGSSPGVCKKTMDICKWGNTLRIIAPIGCVDVLWYNQTLTQELNLSDPHVMWEKGAWNWDTFRKYLTSAPKTGRDGGNLCTFVEWNHNASYIWPSTNGEPYIYIDAAAKTPQVVNNWSAPHTLEAWDFITTVCNSINFAKVAGGKEGDYRNAHLGMYEGTTLMSATMYTQVYRDTEYSKHVQINWVPYPKSTNAGGQEICQYYGFGMMLPRKTAKPDNVDCALKFMELWATRFTETLFDNLHTFEYYNFNYKQRKQYFDFVTQNVVFGLAMNDFEGTPVMTDTNFFLCFQGNAAYNVKTEATKAASLVQNYIVESLKYGQ